MTNAPLSRRTVLQGSVALAAVGAAGAQAAPAPAGIAKLLAIEDIRQLKARYFRCMDTRDWKGLETTVFAPDITFDLTVNNSIPDVKTRELKPPAGGSDMIFNGRDKVLAMMQRGLADVYSIHHGHMAEIEILGPTTAKGLWAMKDTLIYIATNQLRSEGYGHYHEQYVKLAEGWRIKNMRLTRLYKVGIAASSDQLKGK